MERAAAGPALLGHSKWGYTRLGNLFMCQPSSAECCNCILGVCSLIETVWQEGPGCSNLLSSPASPGTKGLECSPSTPTMNSYFYKFMINLLKRFSSERKLLETRGAFIIRSEHPTNLVKAPEHPQAGWDGDDGVKQLPQSQNHFCKPPSFTGRQFLSKQDLPFTCRGTILLIPSPEAK